jgi:outer membrane protein OmpA-like peptidoglycan-associated protein
MRTWLVPLLVCAWVIPAIAQKPGSAKGAPTSGEVTVAGLAKALGEEGSAIVRGIRFEHGTATITPESAAVLAVVGDVLRGDASLRLEIQGHTDNVGAQATNLRVSQAQAAAVRDYLIKTFGVAPDRLTAIGFGDTRPVAANSTENGRAQNRRVELVRTTAKSQGLKFQGSIPSDGPGEWTGRVTTGMMAIGGETTGILLVTDRDQFELEPADQAMRQRLQDLNGKTVTIRGTLETVRGVEIRTRRIIKVTDAFAARTRLRTSA